MEVCIMFCEILNEVENETNRKIKILITDRGNEFIALLIHQSKMARPST